MVVQLDSTTDDLEVGDVIQWYWWPAWESRVDGEFSIRGSYDARHHGSVVTQVHPDLRGSTLVVEGYAPVICTADNRALVRWVVLRERTYANEDNADRLRRLLEPFVGLTSGQDVVKVAT